MPSTDDDVDDVQDNKVVAVVRSETEEVPAEANVMETLQVQEQPAGQMQLYILVVSLLMVLSLMGCLTYWFVNTEEALEAATLSPALLRSSSPTAVVVSPPRWLVPQGTTKVTPTQQQNELQLASATPAPKGKNADDTDDKVSHIADGSSSSVGNNNSTHHVHWCQEIMDMHHTEATQPDAQKYQSPECKNRHYCFLMSVWGRHGAELTTSIFNVFSQRGTQSIPITIVLYSWAGHAGSHAEWVRAHADCFGEEGMRRIKVVYVQKHEDMADLYGFDVANFALDYAEEHLPECTHYAFAQSHNMYAHDFLIAMCENDEDLVVCPFTDRHKDGIAALQDTSTQFVSQLSSMRALVDLGAATVKTSCVHREPKTRFTRDHDADGIFFDRLLAKGCSSAISSFNMYGYSFSHQ